MRCHVNAFTRRARSIFRVGAGSQIIGMVQPPTLPKHAKTKSPNTHITTSLTSFYLHTTSHHTASHLISCIASYCILSNRSACYPTLSFHTTSYHTISTHVISYWYLHHPSYNQDISMPLGSSSKKQRRRVDPTSITEARWNTVNAHQVMSSVCSSCCCPQFRHTIAWNYGCI